MIICSLLFGLQNVKFGLQFVFGSGCRRQRTRADGDWYCCPGSQPPSSVLGSILRYAYLRPYSHQTQHSQPIGGIIVIFFQ